MCSLGLIPDGSVYALDFDWITGNIYGSEDYGFIFVCKANDPGNFVCASVLRGSYFSVRGIAVHPTEG